MWCDFDSTCLGLWQVDLASVVVGATRFGRSGVAQTVATSYGYDITRDPNWHLLRRLRELKMTVAAVPLLASSPGVADEFRLRLDSLLDNHQDASWTPYAQLTPG